MLTFTSRSHSHASRLALALTRTHQACAKMAPKYKKAAHQYTGSKVKDEDEVMSNSGASDSDDRNGKQNEHMRTTGGGNSDYTRKKDQTTSQQ